MSKVVLITGGSSGLGKSIGEHLTNQGYKVYATSRSPQQHEQGDFPLIKMDVCCLDSVKKGINAVIEKEGSIDILINNAGIGITGPTEEVPMEEVEKNFNTNFFGSLRVINTVLPYMRTQRSGLIINITSIAGYFGLPYRGIYSAGKAALEVVTESYRMEIRDFNIKMLSLAPGDFSTNIAAGRYHTSVREDSPYAVHYTQVLKRIDEDVNSGGHPDQVARKVYDIIQFKNPRPHYSVGQFLERKSIFLKRVLPQKLFEKLMIRFNKL